VGEKSFRKKLRNKILPELLKDELFVKELHADFKKKTGFYLSIGFVLKYMGGVAIFLHCFPNNLKLDLLTIFAVLVVIIGFYIFFNGCASYSILKGYPRALGAILSFSDVLGFLILFMLPKRSNRYEIFAKDIENTYLK
jgi:hypothetical protein